MKENSNDKKPIDALIGTSLVQQAEIEVLLFMLEKLMKALGVSTIDGLTFTDWFQKEKIKHLESLLIDIEDKNPASAAYLQSIVDGSKRRRGDKEE
jgi:hypothetical protein